MSIGRFGRCTRVPSPRSVQTVPQPETLETGAEDRIGLKLQQIWPEFGSIGEVKIATQALHQVRVNSEQRFCGGECKNTSQQVDPDPSLINEPDPQESDREDPDHEGYQGGRTT